MHKQKLQNLRKEIDIIDKDIIKLLYKRMQIVKHIGIYKRINNLPIFDQKRWNDVLDNRLHQAKKLGIDKNLIANVFDQIHTSALEIERVLPENTTHSLTFTSKSTKYGIQGGQGSFSEQALLRYINVNKIKNYKIRYLFTTEKVLKNLTEGNIDCGLFAVSNSTGGIVEESMQALAKYSTRIISDFEIPVKHFLMKRKDVDTNTITSIMAHPQVFAQCKQTLMINFSQYKLISGKSDLVDTARAAEYLATDKLPKTTAILGAIGLAEKYNLDIIAENLQDKQDNLTRFLLVKR